MNRCLTCGHDRDQHPPNHFAMFGWHCKVIGCSCGQFAPAAVAGPPPDLQQAIHGFLYPNEDGHRSCVGCGAIPGHGHAAIGHAPRISCPVDLLETQLQAAQAENQQLRDLVKKLEWAAGMCPACHVLPNPDRLLGAPSLHDPDCWLAHALEHQAALGQVDQ